MCEAYTIFNLTHLNFTKWVWQIFDGFQWVLILNDSLILVIAKEFEISFALKKNNSFKSNIRATVDSVARNFIQYPYFKAINLTNVNSVLRQFLLQFQ